MSEAWYRARLRIISAGRLWRPVLLLLCLSPARADEIPDSLRGYTILLSWSEKRHLDTADGIGASHDTVVSGKAAIYLGSLGHIFSRVDRTVAPNVAAAKSFSENDVSDESKNWTWRFERRNLNGYKVHEGGV